MGHGSRTVNRDRFAADDAAPKFAFRALLLYGAMRVTTTVGVALVVVSLVDGEESVPLPPVTAVGLTAAASDAGCVLRTGDAVAAAVPVSGGTSQPASPGFYEDRPRAGALVGALSRGAIVIHYRPDLPGEFISDLRLVQRVMPAGTIVVANADMQFAVAATAWQRLLGCYRLTDGTLDALRLFRGRYIGRGADDL